MQIALILSGVFRENGQFVFFNNYINTLIMFKALNYTINGHKICFSLVWQNEQLRFSL